MQKHLFLGCALMALLAACGEKEAPVAAPAQAEVKILNPCIRWFAGPNQDPSECHGTLGGPELLALMRDKAPGPPQTLSLIQPQGMKSEVGPTCTRLTDTPESGEHFVAGEPINLGKGWYYLSFDSVPTRTELYVYLIADKASILYPWLNLPATTPISSFGEPKLLETVFVQKETSPQQETLRLLIHSAIPQKVQVRWQHGKDSTTIYTGNEGMQSSICSAKFGQLDGGH